MVKYSQIYNEIPTVYKLRHTIIHFRT